MARARISRTTRKLLAIIILVAGAYAMFLWARAHPQHIPFAPFKLSHPIGWATHSKISALGGDPKACQKILRDGGVKFETLPPRGKDSCLAAQLTQVPHQAAFPVAFIPANAAPSCPVSTALILWQRDVVAPAAEAHFGRKVTALRHLGSYNCRNIARSNYRSEHATGNAIDIAGFTLAGGKTISVLKDWDSHDPATRDFLRQVRDGGCNIFSTTLSPDYNRDHADHFHFDMAQRTANYSLCR